MFRLRELFRKVLQVACISHLWVDAAEEVADDGVVFHGGPVEGYDVFDVSRGGAEDLDGHGVVVLELEEGQGEGMRGERGREGTGKRGVRLSRGLDEGFGEYENGAGAQSRYVVTWSIPFHHSGSVSRVSR